MLRALTLTLCAALTLSACARIAESRFNPLNWFGRSVASTPAEAAVRPLVPGATAAQDPRTLIGTVTALTIDRTADGGILRATGVAPTQGFHNAELVLIGAEAGVLTYEFRVTAPPAGAAQGAQDSRTLVSARVLTGAELAGIAAIQVLGATNAQTLRR
jgi:hypothetical protein